MSRLLRKKTKPAGLPPGTLVFTGTQHVDRPGITLIDYDEAEVRERPIENIEDVFPFRDEPSVTWINIDGLHDVAMMEKLGQEFGIHSLVLEDVVSPGQRPKFEEFDDYVYIVIRMLSYDEEKKETVSEQVSLILGKNFVISFQERPGDVFEPVRERIRNKKGKIVKMGPDYLCYALLDIVVDNYFGILEKVDDRVEFMDEEIIEDPRPESLQEIRLLKREMIYLRKSVWPLREVINALERTESGLIKKSTRIYLRDVYDHTIQVIDTVESLKDMLTGIHDVYMSSISNRMNEVMKVLTIIATLFIPLTFMAGIYGMNFEFMPELKYRWAYPTLWGAMLVVAVVMIGYFRKKRWL